jgi:hypothetical protein
LGEIEYTSKTGVMASVMLVFMPETASKLKSVKFDGLAFSSLTGVNDVAIQSGLSVYPNPFKDQLTLQNVGEGDLLKIYDVLGNEVRAFTATSQNPSVSLSDLKAGVYFVESNVQGTVSRIKVVKN